MHVTIRMTTLSMHRILQRGVKFLGALARELNLGPGCFGATNKANEFYAGASL